MGAAPPDGTSPEAEWGFAPALSEDVERFAQRHGYRVERVRFEQPEAMSPLVADLYRWWYERLGVADNRLVVDSFILMEPYWTTRTRSVPVWMVFNTEGSFSALDDYLRQARPFDELLITLFSHGVDSIGLVPIENGVVYFRELCSMRTSSVSTRRHIPGTSGSSSDITSTFCARYPRIIRPCRP